MMDQEQQLKKLLEIKRHESPGKPYFDAFVDQFHIYQRSSVLEVRKSWWLRWKLGLSEILEDLKISPELVVRMAGSACALAFLSGILLIGHLNQTNSAAGLAGISDKTTAQNASETEAFANGEGIYENAASNQTEIALAQLSSFDGDFENSSYVTGEAALAYDSVLAF